MISVLLALALYVFIAAPVLQLGLLDGSIYQLVLLLLPLFSLVLSQFKAFRLVAHLCFFLLLLFPIYLQAPQLQLGMTTAYALVYLGVIVAQLYLAQERSFESDSEQDVEGEKARQALEAELFQLPSRSDMPRETVQTQAYSKPIWHINLISPLIFALVWSSGLVLIWGSKNARLAIELALIWTLLMSIAGQQYFWPLLISHDWLAYKTRRRAEADLEKRKTHALRYFILLVIGLGLLFYIGL